MSAATKRVVIVQSNYIPWKGYFDLINFADELVLFDEVQYTRRDWRNRNKIKTPDGLIWLSIPVKVKGRYHQRIDETELSDRNWAHKHWKTIEQCYAKAPHFEDYQEPVRTLYETVSSQLLSCVNYQFLVAINEILGIKTHISRSTDYSHKRSTKSERLLEICLSTKATHYLSGPAAKDYLDVALFSDAGIEVEWMDYSGYPEYQQLFGKFEHGVSIIDLIFNAGPDATKYMKSF